MAPQPGSRLLQLGLVCGGGAHHEGPTAGGLATLTASLLDEGTSAATALEIAARVEGLGGSLSTSADWDAIYLTAATLADHQESALALLADLAADATLPEHEVQRLRSQRLAELQRRLAQPGFVAGVELAAAIYGDSAYGRSLLGSQSSVAGLERSQMLAYARRHVSPRGATLIAAGDFDPGALVARAGEMLAGWQGPAPEPAPQLAPPATARRRLRIVDRPDSPQTELRFGQAGVPRRDPDFPPLQVLNSLLGGKFTSRLNLSLRERHAVTYGAYSRVTGRLGPGPIVLGAAVANEAAGLAVGEILAQLERLREEPVPEEELSDARDYLLGVFPYTLQTIGGVAQRLETLAVHSLPDDYWPSYLARIESVDATDLLRCAGARLQPQAAAIVAVGPARELAPQLEPFGELEVRGPDDGQALQPAAD